MRVVRVLQTEIIRQTRPRADRRSAGPLRLRNEIEW